MLGNQVIWNIKVIKISNLYKFIESLEWSLKNINDHESFCDSDQ